MMTIAEQRFMSIVESSLQQIVKQLEKMNELKNEELELKKYEITRT